jgi:quinol monooxygenase YgiN
MSWNICGLRRYLIGIEHATFELFHFSFDPWRVDMVKVALWVRLEAKPGKEGEVEAFLRSGLPLVEAEPATTVWFGLRIGPSTFGIFDAFPDEAGRNAHLSGAVAAALGQKAAELLAAPPVIERVDVLAAKLSK